MTFQPSTLNMLLSIKLDLRRWCALLNHQCDGCACTCHARNPFAA